MLSNERKVVYACTEIRVFKIIPKLKNRVFTEYCIVGNSVTSGTCYTYLLTYLGRGRKSSTCIAPPELPVVHHKQSN